MSAAHRAAALLVPLLAVVLTSPAAGQSGSVAGYVHDSIADAPLVDAAVFLWDTPHRGVTDADGRFRIDDVPPGDYSILFFHTDLGRRGISPGPRSVTVEPAARTDVTLATPSISTVVHTQCLITDHPEGSGAVAGLVSDGASDVPLGGARVTLSWQDGESPTPRTLQIQTDREGWFQSCAVPADVPVLVSGTFYGREAVRREIRVDPSGFTEVPLRLFEQRASRITGQLVDNSSEDGVEGAEAWLRGTNHRVLTDGGGHFQLEGVQPGTYMLMTDHLAYGTKMDTLVVPPDKRLLVEMRLDTRPIEIAPLTVATEAAPVTIDRRRGGIVITREEIDEVRQTARDAADVMRSLHVTGVIVRRINSGRTCVGFTSAQVKMNQSGCVEMVVYINDVRATNPEIALRMPPDGIERMVVYKPVEAGNLFGLGGGNGVWMIYTRGN